MPSGSGTVIRYPRMVIWPVVRVKAYLKLAPRYGGLAEEDDEEELPSEDPDEFVGSPPGLPTFGCRVPALAPPVVGVVAPDPVATTLWLPPEWLLTPYPTPRPTARVHTAATATTGHRDRGTRPTMARSSSAPGGGSPLGASSSP
jgi:hypothetical protein